MPPSRVMHLLPEIVRRNRAGESGVSISRSLGLSPNAVGSILRRKGLNTNARKRSRLEAAWPDVLAAYDSGLSMAATGELFGVSQTVIRHLLLRHNIARHRKPRPFTSDQLEDLTRRYSAGDSCPLIGRTSGRPSGSIRDALKRQGVILRPSGASQRRVPLDESAFDTVTERSAYWAGFLMGDGCVRSCRDGWRVSLLLAAADRAHVESFRDFLGSGHAICEGNRVSMSRSGRTTPTKSVTLAIPSKRLAESLARFGVVPRKTLTARVIGLENDRHFWRGEVDADGSLYYTTKTKVNPTGRSYTYLTPNLALVGSRQLMGQFSEFVRGRTLTLASVRPRGNVWYYSLQGRAALDVIRVLYGGCEVALPRKLRIAGEMLATFKDGPAIRVRS